jgi:multisubunit Na+/H+ antiporter MnhF subunit
MKNEFEIQEIPNTFTRILGSMSSLSVVLLLTSFYIIIYNQYTYLDLIYILPGFIGLNIISLFLKRNRILCKIIFDDKNDLLTIKYIQFIFKIYTVSIPYSNISFNYYKRTYNIIRTWKIYWTLDLLENKRFLIRINDANFFGWQKVELETLIELLEKRMINKGIPKDLIIFDPIE